jgi:hypothetical protein
MFTRWLSSSSSHSAEAGNGNFSGNGSATVASGGSGSSNVGGGSDPTGINLLPINGSQERLFGLENVST